MPSNITEDILRAMEEFKTTGLGKLRAWKPPPGRAWTGQYNRAIRMGYSEKFATIYANQRVY